MPFAMSDTSANSSGQWLSPSLHGINIIAAGTTLESWAVSWPAPLSIILLEKPSVSEELLNRLINSLSISTKGAKAISSMLIWQGSVLFIDVISSCKIFINSCLEFWLVARKSIVISTNPGIIAAEFGRTSIFPIVETKCWLLFLDIFKANLLTKVIIFDALTRASARWFINIVPLWPACPDTVTLNLEILGIDLTTPISIFLSSKTFPCSIWSSKHAKIFFTTGSGLFNNSEFPPILFISSFKIFPEEFCLKRISSFRTPAMPLLPIHEVPHSFSSSPK